MCRWKKPSSAWKVAEFSANNAAIHLLSLNSKSVDINIANNLSLKLRPFLSHSVEDIRFQTIENYISISFNFEMKQIIVDQSTNQEWP